MKRLLAIMLFVAFALAPGAALAQSNTSASLGGTVTDESGAPLASAAVTLIGIGKYSTFSDAKGAYAFASIAPGSYELTVSKAGYESATESDVFVLAGTPLTIGVTLRVASFSSLRTIGSVRATRGGNFNTSTASVNVVNAQAIAAQGAIQVTQILSQVPGVQISFPGASANGASPGAITVPNIRNGLSYETASLIDGHPVSVGQFGDYVTTFLNPALLGSIEVVKGPGANAPQVNYAINGTANFRTKDPTPDAQTFYTAGATNTGGDVYSFGVSDTILDGRLGFVVGIAGYDEISALNNAPVYFDPGTGSGDINGINTYPYGCSGVNGSSGPTPPLGTSKNQFYSKLFNGCTAVATATVSSEYDSLSELIKLKYKVGNQSYLTASYFGNQATSNQSGNTAGVIPSLFQPGAGYTGSLKPGSQINVLSAAYDAQPQFETNNEPIFQLEFSTAIKNDTFLARYYHATIDRIQMAGNPNPLQPYLQYTNIYGTLSAFNRVFNGGPILISQYNYFNDVEQDLLTGYSLEDTHPIGTKNELTLAADFTARTSTDFENDFSFEQNQCQLPQAPNGYCYNTATSLPAGSAQNFTTIQLRDHEQFTPKLSGVVSLYQNVYQSFYPTNCASTFNDATTNQTVCLPNGNLQTWSTGSAPMFVSQAPVNFGETTLHHLDPRFGLEWRPQNDLAVRFAAGSSIAPPFLFVLGQPNSGIITPANGALFATETLNSGNLQPETAFGYDLGSDYAFKDGVTFATGDIYLTNLYGQFLDETYLKGLCPVPLCKPRTALIASQYINLSNARYEGLELAIKRVPVSGWGYQLQGSTQRGYAYDLPSNFYCQFHITKKTPCNPSTYNTNLNILPGQNYYGEYINNTGSTTSGVDNQSVPYLQGDAQISYHFKNGAFALFGETLYGKNNSLNRPPFGLAYMSVNYPINHDIAIQIAGTNIFNAYSGLFPVYGGGVTVPLAVTNKNGTPLSAATIGNVLGPARYQFLLTKAFGPAPYNCTRGTPGC